MTIVIFGDLFTFPHGWAATNRVHTYAKGFVENGVNVHVICFFNDYLDKNEGVVDGINYYHPFGRKKRSDYFIVRTWQKLLKYPNTFSRIRRINKADKIIAINGWSDLLYTNVFGRLLSTYLGVKFIAECSEYPLRFFQGSALKKKHGEIKFSIEAAMSDGVFCISHFLIEFFKSKGVNSRKLFLVPSTVDPYRFSSAAEKPVDYKYIGYFGSLTFGRDNIDLLIKAFGKFSKQNHGINLIIAGFCSDAEREEILKLIAELDIKTRVLVLGALPREVAITYTAHAEILVMVRSNNVDSQASFPSKLTECLASSKPVISVNVGEISLYLKDGSDVFLVEPGNVEAMAEKLSFVWNNYELARKVGEKGKQLTETVFNYKYQAKRMIEFINSI